MKVEQSEDNEELSDKLGTMVCGGRVSEGRMRMRACVIRGSEGIGSAVAEQSPILSILGAKVVQAVELLLLCIIILDAVFWCYK